MQTVKFYSLSTCIWCRKTRAHLDEAKIQYEEITVDELKGEEKEKVLRELAKHNPVKSFPTLVFGNGTVIVGFKPEEIREAYGK